MKVSPTRPRFEGLAVAKSAGVVIGVVKKVDLQQASSAEFDILASDVEHELQRLRLAVHQASQSLQSEIQSLRSGNSADDVVLILEVHQMMLHDPELVGATEQLIQQGLINAEWALQKSLNRIGDGFDQIKDEYLRSRKADIEHVGQRILSNLCGEEVDQAAMSSIMLALDFSPSDVVSMWKKGALGFVSAQGGADSHAMIVARGVGLSGLAGVQGLFALAEDNDVLILDAEQGCWILNPDAAELAQYQNFQQSLALVEQGLQSFIHLSSTSKSGYTMPLMANLEFAEETAVAQRFGVDGVGLYRTEFLFLQGLSLPDEAMQREHYQQVLENMGDKPVIFRLLDVGADKISTATALLGLDESENPALGLRGVRLLLHQRGLLHTQLRAIVQAVAGKNESQQVSILVPMVTQVAEMLEIRQALHDVQQDLAMHQHIGLGCMIEVPAAALIADELAQVSDFLSIGSNDLMQYSLAVDRADEHVGHLYDANHPAIKMLIGMIVQAAHRQAVPVSLCGELAANTAWTQFFLDIKMTSLSMSSRCVLAVRKQLQALS